MKNNLIGKKVLVSGGSMGIGYAIAKELLSRGAKVIIFSREQKHVDKAVASLSKIGEIYGLIGDVSSGSDLKKVYSFVKRKFTYLDILINNAGLPANGLQTSDLETIKYVMDVNLGGYMYCTKLALSLLNHGSQIVFIGSLSSQTRDSEGELYVATKAGVNGLAEAFRKTQTCKSRVILIEPGAVATNLHGLNQKELALKLKNGDMLSAEDVANEIVNALNLPINTHISYLAIKPFKQKI